MEGIENICKRNGQRWYLDLTKVSYRGVCDESEMRRLERNGHHVLVMFDGKQDNVYITKKTDGLLREPAELWHRELKLFPYEPVQKVWVRNVRWWFDEAMKDAEYMDDLTSLFPDVDVKQKMVEVMNELSSYEVKSYGGRKGKRTSNIDDFLMNTLK
jgi:hypothetical protein